MPKSLKRLLPAVVPPTEGPSPEEMRAFLGRRQCSQAFLAEQFGTSARSMQRWCNDNGGQRAPAAFWTFMRLVKYAVDGLEAPPQNPPTPEEMRQFLSRFQLSQKTFASACGVTPRTVRVWLSEKRTISPPRWLNHIMLAIEIAQTEPIRFNPEATIAALNTVRPARHRWGGFGEFRARLAAGEIPLNPSGRISGLGADSAAPDQWEVEEEEEHLAAIKRYPLFRQRRMPAPVADVKFEGELDRLVIERIGWTHREAARRSRIHYSTFHRWVQYNENKKYAPPSELLQWLRKIAGAIESVGPCPKLTLHRRRVEPVRLLSRQIISDSSEQNVATSPENHSIDLDGLNLDDLVTQIGWRYSVLARKTHQVSVVTLLRWAKKSDIYPPPGELMRWLMDIKKAIEFVSPCPDLPKSRINVKPTN